MTELTDETKVEDLSAEALVGGTVPAFCSFSPGTKDFKGNVNLTLPRVETNGGVKPVKVRFGFPLKCNFGAHYSVTADARFGTLKNISDGGIGDSDISYTANIYLFNRSTVHPWGTSATLPALAGVVPADTEGSRRSDFTKADKVYTDKDVPVDGASGRGKVAVIGELTLLENENSKLTHGEGGYAWRAGVYAEVFTLTVKPKVSFADYCNSTNSTAKLLFGGTEHSFKSCGGGGGSGTTISDGY